jgi:hypothetical protein
MTGRQDCPIPKVAQIYHVNALDAKDRAGDPKIGRNPAFTCVRFNSFAISASLRTGSPTVLPAKSKGRILTAWRLII